MAPVFQRNSTPPRPSRTAEVTASTSRARTSPIRSSHHRTSRLQWTMSNREELPLSSLIGRRRGTKRHVTDERLEVSSDRRASSTSHSNEKKKKHGDHQRLQKMLRNSVLNDSSENLISQRRKLEQENETFRQENAKLKNQLYESKREARAAKEQFKEQSEEATEQKHKAAEYKRRAEKWRIQNLDKEKILEQKNRELVRLRADLCQLENTLACPPTPSTSAPETDGDFFQDVMANLKDSIENQFSCAICTEVFIDSTTLHCGHTFCTFCLEEWEAQNATCPVCRADIDCKHPTKIIDGYIDKFVSQFYSETSKASRVTLIQERSQKKDERARREDIVRGNLHQRVLSAMAFETMDTGGASRFTIRLNRLNRINSTFSSDSEDQTLNQPLNFSTPNAQSSSSSTSTSTSSASSTRSNISSDQEPHRQRVRALVRSGLLRSILRNTESSERGSVEGEETANLSDEDNNQSDVAIDTDPASNQDSDNTSNHDSDVTSNHDSDIGTNHDSDIASDATNSSFGNDDAPYEDSEIEDEDDNDSDRSASRTFSHSSDGAVFSVSEEDEHDED